MADKSFERADERYQKLIQVRGLKRATLAGGCFWCMQAPFDELDGLEATIVGYAGEKGPRPRYEEVVMGQKRYREAVQIFFDPKQVRFDKLLELYWYQIDPTDTGGQFADRGFQYTTAIYYHDQNQKRIAEKQINKLNQSKSYQKPIATKVLPYSSFYPAEDKHQNFYQTNPGYYKRYKIGSGRQAFIESQVKLRKPKPTKTGS